MTKTTLDVRHDGPVRHDVFVVYAQADHHWVHGFLLPELGLDATSVVTPESLPLGGVQVEELERAVESARVTVLVLSPAFQAGPWSQLAELLASHESMRRHTELVPLLLQPYPLPLHLRLPGAARLHRPVAMVGGGRPAAQAAAPADPGAGAPSLPVPGPDGLRQRHLAPVLRAST